jgi:NAD(P)-dependent dehydrogenase (short-subunit alcohol dehydrogenase family)
MEAKVLAGKVILLTQARQFIGPVAAPALSAAGASVAVADPAFADPDVRGAFAAAHPDLRVIAASSAAEMVAQVEASLGPIDVAISNDAFPAHRLPIGTATDADAEAAFAALALQPFAFARAVAPGMVARGRGHILFISSAAPLRGLANYSLYCAARGATNALALALARELGPSGVRVNALAPNFVENEDYFPASLRADATAMAKITSQIPLRRLGRPEEVAATLTWLASDGSGFVTGQVIPFAGGWA